ncbi:MAG: homoserine dehydrogenase [Candidatus Jordarchaeum sp.]|uniref:homoserine dehydrogenase n=1 Tax=Candidatus Jordarchaeum sp. TaxID=2823881 RepID=UPI00404A56F8
MKIAIVGFGNVGRAVAEVMLERRELFQKVDFEPKVVAVFERDGSWIDENGLKLQELLSKGTSSPSWVEGAAMAEERLADLDCDLIVEMTVTNIEDGEPGLTHIVEALNSGKDVVTSNKGPLVLAFPELMEIAEKKNRMLLYEATVGGAIPVFHVAREALLVNRIISITGILNGTSNYILTKMTDEKVSFNAALREAQEKGYAEADPTYDIEGIDAASKLVILANGILKTSKSIKDVRIEGITRITPEMTELAMEDGYLVKHIGYVDRNRIEVIPRLIPRSSPLAVGGTLNVISLKTDVAQDITLIGRGAGPRETSSAILGDILHINKIRKEN